MLDSVSFQDTDMQGGQLVGTEEMLRHGKFETHGTLHWFLGNILSFAPPFYKDAVLNAVLSLSFQGRIIARVAPGSF